MIQCPPGRKCRSSVLSSAATFAGATRGLRGGGAAGENKVGPLGRRSQLSASPCVRCDRLHRVGEQISHRLMNVSARKAFERLDVEADRAGGTTRQHGSRLARGAEWSQDSHDAIAFSFRRERYRTLSHRWIGAVIGPACNLGEPKAVQYCSSRKS